jgi:hypothetical protein
VEDTKCRNVCFRHADECISGVPGWNLDRITGYCEMFFVIYTSGCPCEFRFFLHIISTQQNLNKTHDWKFKIKVITDYYRLFNRSPEHRSCHEMSRQMQAFCAMKMPCSGRNRQDSLRNYLRLKIRVDSNDEKFSFFLKIWEISPFCLNYSKLFNTNSGTSTAFNFGSVQSKKYSCPNARHEGIRTEYRYKHSFLTSAPMEVVVIFMPRALYRREKWFRHPLIKRLGGPLSPIGQS